VQALIRTGSDAGVPLDVLVAVEAVNDRQKRRLYEKVARALGGDLKGKTIAVWGLAFKAETDDMRESPAIPLVEALLASGAQVSAYDPQAMRTARTIFGDRIRYAEDPYAALAGADALVIVTEWLVFRNPDFARIKQSLRQPLIVDGRNLYEPRRMAALGFRYVGIGRGVRA
jgi:UDPglucose 6-dehydrogenase